MGEARRAGRPLSSDETRAGRMVRSVETALRARRIAAPTAETVMTAVGLAMARRVDRLTDDHHPAYLHPGRTVLVLLHDVEALEPAALPLAALHDSRDEPLRVALEDVRAGLGAPWADALAAIPLPGDEALAERLVLLPLAGAQAALAERLDHLRHLHLRPELEGRWRDTYDEVERVWRPFAGRIDERLARRYAHWSRTFARRLGRAGH